jgi:hypothetical protein
MRKILLFFVLALTTLVACRHDDSVNPSNNNSSISTNGITIPQSVFNYVTDNYAGYSITEVQTEVEGGVTYYKVKIIKGDSDIRLFYTTNWVFVRALVKK